jgi:hypothetical protein
MLGYIQAGLGAFQRDQRTWKVGVGISAVQQLLGAIVRRLGAGDVNILGTLGGFRENSYLGRQDFGKSPCYR